MVSEVESLTKGGHQEERSWKRVIFFSFKFGLLWKNDLILRDLVSLFNPSVIISLETLLFVGIKSRPLLSNFSVFLSRTKEERLLMFVNLESLYGYIFKSLKRKYEKLFR